MLKQYSSFLKRSMHTFPEDITQPYHKIIDLLFKLFSLYLGIYGFYEVMSATHCYFSVEHSCVSLSGISDPIVAQSTVFQHTLMMWLSGAGKLMATIFIALILVVRHLNETLPDHIYLRNFATPEERKQRLPIK